MTLPDEKLLVATFLKTRSEKHFRMIYRHYTTYLFNLALKLHNGDRALAEDTIQNTWIRAIESLPGFRWESSLKTWLSGITINCSRERRKKEIYSELDIEQTDKIFENNFSADSKLDIKTAMSLLPSGYREILILHDFEGYKHDEIGNILGISEGTSKCQESNKKNIGLVWKI